ncbi:ABC transporter ATP-binding protein [soil metagenome]
MSTQPQDLEISGLVVGYSGSTVIDDVSIIARAGQITALIGPNGAGKTTLLHAVGGFVRPRKGSVSIGAQDVTSQPPHKIAAHGISNVLEGRRVFRDMTVEDNLKVAASRSRPDMPSRTISDMFDLFPILETRRRLNASALSGGEQQMLAIASSLLTPTTMLLIDELSLGLAPRVVSEILATLRTLADEGIGVLLVEQSVRQAVDSADHVFVLSSGRIALSMSPDDPDAAEATIAALFGGRP